MDSLSTGRTPGGSPARRRVRLTAAVVASLALLAPASAAAGPDSGADVLIERITEQALQAGLDPDQLLGAPIELGDGPGEASTVREAIDGLAGRLVVDEDANGGIAGTPELAAGGVFHLYVDTNLEIFPGLLPSALPTAPDLLRYDVAESGYSPATPLVPVINPLLLAGAELPEEAPEGLSSPILLLHGGGKLKSVQGSGWDLASHGAGSHALGANADTQARETAEGDPWPVWVPVATGGTVPDERIDFLGFGQVVQSQGCTLVTRFGRVFARVCISFGAILGDGVAGFEDGPVDFRNDLMPLWEQPPETVATAIAAADEAIGQVPLGDLLGLLDQVPEAPAVPGPAASAVDPAVGSLGARRR